ncbi:hypothetical protein Zmor_014988 [Zophobas morio]|uniref:Putative nuclease HARBI1 n=1 Tax=Zophobas morio TaxID=2755281 RepID=A0AA38IJ58_9CUCU|nr:hypothetical protein Zmor_014988 [Zophobas morio]
MELSKRKKICYLLYTFLTGQLTLCEIVFDDDIGSSSDDDEEDIIICELGIKKRKRREVVRIKNYITKVVPKGNERADEMAKRTARMPFGGPEPAITPSVALSNELVKQYTQRRHEQIWVKLSSCRHSRACMATPDQSRMVPNYNRTQFRSHFRISYEAYEGLLVILGPRLQRVGNKGRNIIPVEKQLLSVLWLLATPDSYRSVGERFDMGKSSLSVSFMRVVKTLNVLGRQLISWPRGERVESVKRRFFEMAHIPNVIGAVDGTFVPIKAPERDAEVYITRKCHYAITLQGICDSFLKFTDVYVGYPGSVSDTRIFRNSDVIPTTVLAACILHNICLEHDEVQYGNQYIAEGQNAIHGNEEAARHEIAERNGRVYRDQLCQTLFQELQ